MVNIIVCLSEEEEEEDMQEYISVGWLVAYSGQGWYGGLDKILLVDGYVCYIS